MTGQILFIDLDQDFIPSKKTFFLYFESKLIRSKLAIVTTLYKLIFKTLNKLILVIEVIFLKRYIFV